MRLKNFLVLALILLSVLQLTKYYLYNHKDTFPIYSEQINEDQGQAALEEAKLKLLDSFTPEKDPIYFTELDPIFVNLPSANKRGGERSVEVVIIVQYQNPSTESALDSNKHLVRDRVITALSLRDPKQILDLSNRGDISKELTLVLNAIFEPDLVQLFISANPDKYRNSEYILKLQEFGVLPNDQSLKITPEIISTSKQLTNKSFPIRNILFKEIKIN